jgi:hypothetical protein
MIRLNFLITFFNYFLNYIHLITHVPQKLTQALTPSPSPAGEGNEKTIEILLPFSCGRRGWGMRADLRSA